MASSCSWLIIFSFLFVKITIVNSEVNGCFKSIFSFGDSLTDTGNLLHLSISASTKLPHSAFSPNGRTFFHHPTGRCSDGRLVIDFLAEALGFSFLPPYFGGKNGRSQSLQKGVNFAVAGATALDYAFLKERGILSHSKRISLRDEMGFFKNFLSHLCSYSSDCKEILQSSLIVMGEIGGNDYNYAFRERKNVKVVRQSVPLVVQAIASAINELIDLGAVTFLVPGNLPIGCNPSILTYFEGSHKAEYDPITGCLTWANQFSEFHNELLRKELKKIQKLHPNINIIYGDYFKAAMRIYNSPKKFGFGETIKACCGMGGLYNYNSSTSCGYPPLKSCCNNPSSFVSWDGIHYTEATYRIISREILEALNTTLLVSPNHCEQEAQKY
ncbi:hypothetical protein DITRI_Ditri01bG0178300 [Diplodiscus trichospermus]